MYEEWPGVTVVVPPYRPRAAGAPPQQDEEAIDSFFRFFKGSESQVYFCVC